MELAAYFCAILFVVIAAMLAAYLLWARRHFGVYEKMLKTSTFHCLKCDSVYVSRGGEKSKACPNCGYKNAEMKF